MLSTRGYSLLCLEFRRDHQAQQPCQPWCLQRHLIRRMLVTLLKFFRHRNQFRLLLNNRRNQFRLLLNNRRTLQTSETDHQFQLSPLFLICFHHLPPIFSILLLFDQMRRQSFLTLKKPPPKTPQIPRNIGATVVCTPRLRTRIR